MWWYEDLSCMEFGTEILFGDVCQRDMMTENVRNTFHSIDCIWPCSELAVNINLLSTAVRPLSMVVRP